MKHFFIVIDTFIISLFCATSAFAQSGAIQGTITDAKTGESLIGTNIVLQGTYTGTTSDLEGNFKLANIPPGTYNLVVSYISYDQQILRITVKNNETTRVDVKLEPATLEIESVKVTAVRKTNTEMALISSLKASNVVANGISNQQIIRSQDKDASEVVRRVPGITIRDGRFVIVRGLVERYNVTWLNGIPAPSSEPDMRSFSFDLIPSSQIDNIVIYKTPAPELPADFAGAAIQISSLGISDRNSVSIAYSAGFIEGSTFRKYYSYKGGKYDWLGFDDGTRALPAGFPSTKDFRALASNSSDADKLRIQEIGRSFNKIWTPFASSSAPLNQNLNIAFTRRVLLGKSSLGLVSSVLYNRTTDSDHILRQGFQAYNTILDKSNPYYIYNDNKYKQTSRIGALLNMNFVFGNNQKIEFRNLVNQQGASTTTLRRGQNFYGGNYEKNYELDYQSRLTYTSSLGGKHTLFNQLTSFDWNAGYAYADQNRPDIRRVQTSLSGDLDPKQDPFRIGVNFNADPKMLGRLFLQNHEHLKNLNINISQKIPLGSFVPELKAGFLYTDLSRTFTARNIGFAFANIFKFNWSMVQLPVDSSDFSPSFFGKINDLFSNENINPATGLKIDESTNKSDSYQAWNKTYATYIGLVIPLLNRIKIYSGVRYENNAQRLYGHLETGDSIRVNNVFKDLFPSVNLTFNVSSDLLLRFAYGKTVNRPEFREISPFAFFDFDENASIYGNPALKNAYIHNTDLRLEWYPSQGEIVSLGVFNKNFIDPIEKKLVNVGSGYNYTFRNANSAYSRGVELDMRKSFLFLENSSSFFHLLKDFTLVFNGSLIQSQINNPDPNERDSVRVLQGQSPYILNAGLYYQNDKSGLSLSALYNVIGKRIDYIGDLETPHIWEMPFHSLDFTFSIKTGRFVTIKLGAKNVLNDIVLFRQYEEPVLKDTQVKVTRIQVTRKYVPGRQFSCGISLTF